MNNCKRDFDQLREEFKHFIYRSYDISINNNQLEINYSFEIEGLSTFNPKWIFPLRDRSLQIEDSYLKVLVFSLGMVELVSYYKISCAKECIIEADSITPIDLSFWKKLYFNGLGEFFYVNNINISPDELLCFSNKNSYDNLKDYNFAYDKSNFSGVLIPIGGGKDSLVTMELLHSHYPNSTIYSINGIPSQLDCFELSDFKDIYIARRSLDKKMLELNNEGFLNGHTPFSAIVAFSSLIAAYITEKKYISLSNEASANESTVIGTNINHQYSKSFEFEEDFHNYAQNILHSNSYYFSFLRPITEFQIAQLFAKNCKKYLKVFKSCNRGQKQNIWCGNCPKCLFVYLILSPFLDNEELDNIFTENPANNVELTDTLMELCGVAPTKPFECIGSVNEVLIATTLGIQRRLRNKEQLPLLMNLFFELGLLTGMNEENNLFTYYNKENLLPPEFDSILKEALLKNESE